MGLLLITEDEFESVKPITEGVDGQKTLFIEGIFLQGEMKNRNGRIYPETILDREANRYLKEAISKNRALGELNHPACYVNDDFEVLTPSGWRWFNDLSVGDPVYSKNKDNKFVVGPVLNIIKEQYEGDAYHIKGRHIDSTVTPNHRFFLIDRYGNELVETIADIEKSPSAFNSTKIIKVVKYEGDTPNEIVIPGVSMDGVHPDKFNTDVTQDLHIPTELFVKFFGIWLAEGSISPKKYMITITQNIGDVCDEISDMLHQLPFVINENDRQNRDNIIRSFSFSDKRLHTWLKNIGNQYVRCIPQAIKNLDYRYLDILIEWFGKGDGRKVINGQKKHIGMLENVFSVSKQLVDDLQECLIKAGYHGNISVNKCTEDYVFADHTIEAKNKSVLYVLNISRTSGIWLDRRHKFDITKVHSNSGAYCIETENGNFYVRDHGKCYLTGNSPQVNPERASHLITSMVKEGTNWKGKAKVLNTPMGNIVRGLIEGGVQIGVSSRGLGSLKESTQGKIVQPDFYLSTVDIVSDPSAHDAWVNGIYEGKEWACPSEADREMLMQQIDAHVRNTKHIDESFLLQKFEQYVNHISAGA